MRSGTFYVIYIKCAKDVSFDTIKRKMSLCRSWYRFNENTWIVYSTSDVDKLYGRFSPIVEEDGNIFICELDINNKQGWMNEKFWEWINKYNEQQ